MSRTRLRSVFLSPPFFFSELKSNKLRRLPDLRHCRQLRLLDLQHNEIDSLQQQQGDNLEDDEPASPLSSSFAGLDQLQDILLGHNSISRIDSGDFRGLDNLQIL